MSLVAEYSGEAYEIIWPPAQDSRDWKQEIEPHRERPDPQAADADGIKPVGQPTTSSNTVASKMPVSAINDRRSCPLPWTYWASTVPLKPAL